MTSHEHSVVVDRPLMTVYDQWTQFESYPRFMDNVDDVRQLDDATTHWRVSVAGVSREYDAHILEQRPGELIAWESIAGPRQAGSVRFSSLDADRTRVTLRLDFEPRGVTEKLGDSVGFVSSSVEDSLERFKEFIEDRGSAEGGWRGEISDGMPMQGGASASSYGDGVGMTGTASGMTAEEPELDLREPQVPTVPPVVSDRPGDGLGSG